MKKENVREILHDSIQGYVEVLRDCIDLELAIGYAAGIKECYYIAESLGLFDTDHTVLSYAETVIKSLKELDKRCFNHKIEGVKKEAEDINVKRVRDILLERVRKYKDIARLSEDLEELMGCIRAIECCRSMVCDIGCESISNARYLYPVVKKYNKIYEQKQEEINENNDQEKIREILDKEIEDYRTRINNASDSQEASMHLGCLLKCYDFKYKLLNKTNDMIPDIINEKKVIESLKEKELRKQESDLEELKKEIAQDYNSNFKYFLNSKFLNSVKRIRDAKNIPEILYHASMGLAAINFQKELKYVDYSSYLDYKKEILNTKFEAIERVNKSWGLY